MTKTVLVTGATSGIGFSCAIKFAQHGWRVICVGRNEKKLNDVAKNVKEAGGTAFLVTSDMSKINSSKFLLEEVGNITDTLDAIVNSAGNVSTSSIIELSDEEWEDTFRINVTSAFSIVREAIPYLHKSVAPSVVNISSVAGRLRSISLSCAYSTSKAAVIGMTRHLAGELGPSGIRVNCICPSQTLTPMLDAALSKEGQEKLAQSIPLRRLAKPEEQASVIYFLCTDEASYINGSIIDVNGGIL